MIEVAISSSRGDYAVRERPFDSLLAGVDAIVTDANVAPLLPPSGLPRLVLPPGEATKSLARFGEALDFFASSRLSRRSRVAACGGGVVGDLAGFAAAAYMRGIAYVQVPTTLLAMVDSSVGGKVAVDLPAGKNLAGAFHPPAEVRLHLPFLETLPARELAAGMAEAVKSGAILDPALFDRLDDRAYLVRRCVELKAQIVAEDEDETNGRRAILNFGHTIGHAVEQVTRYARFLHGEAIAIGLVAEARLGERIGLTERGVADRLRPLLDNLGLPTRMPADLDPDALLAAMRTDKKAEGGRLAFALVGRLGEARLVPDVPEAEVRAIIAEAVQAA